jgi:putative membrane protein
MSRTLRIAAAGGAALALVLPSVATASPVTSTGDSTPQVVNRETVAAELSSTGKLDVARLISQLTVYGSGTVRVADPTSSKNVRNLDGFSAPDIKDGKALYTITSDGTASRRTVSDFTKKLPVTVEADYTFNGKKVNPKDVVGKTGDLAVHYAVTNVSGAPTTITWKDGKGVTQTATVDLVTPLVGQLQTTLPGTFTNLDTPRADVAGDGRGGTVLTYTMVLFEPIGAITQEFGWSGHVKNAQIPSVQVQLVPVPPNRKPELKFGEDGFKEGAAQASELTAGAGLIDANLLKLQNGASDLLGGLTKLAAGAVELRNGLVDSAAPGASKLAAGAKDAKAGSAALATGASAASSGASDLAAGIAQILAGVKALPTTIKTDADYQKLLGALTSVQAGIGTAADVTPTTLLGGLNLLTYGLRSPLGVTGCDQAAAPGSATACGAADAVQLVQEQLAAAVATGGAVDQLIAAAAGAYALSGCTVPPAGTTPVAGVLPPTSLTPGTSCWLISNVAYGLGLPKAFDPAGKGGLKDQTATASGVLAQVFAGVDASMLPGIAKLKAGLSNPACNLADPTNAANPCGVKEVQGLVSAGIGQLVAAISSQLSAALSQASTGANDLADGMKQLQAGSAQLDTGLGTLSGGAGALSDGLTSAANGSQQLADGLGQAKTGNGQLVAGAGQLRSEGTSKLVSAGNDTASVNAERYAQMVALNDSAADGALPYGAPEGATGSAVYSLTLAAATSAGRDNTTRSVAALVVLGAALALSWTLKRRIASR